MPQTLQNGIQTPINADAYNLTADLATMGGKANVIITVANQAAMLALTSPYAGMTVARLDLPGVPTMTYNGTAWPPEPFVNISTYGANWAATNTTNHQPRIRMDGNQCFLYGAVTAASGASGGSILTVPTAYQPPTASTRFVGAVIASNGQYTELALSAGVLSSVAGYGNLSVSSGVIIPLVCSWWMD